MNEYLTWLIEIRRKTLVEKQEELWKQCEAIAGELKTIAGLTTPQTSPPPEQEKEPK